MSLAGRIVAYVLCWLLFSAYIIWSMISESQANLKNDPSSMAVWGFLPFILPFLLLETLLYCAPVAGVIEIAIAIYRKWFA